MYHLEKNTNEIRPPLKKTPLHTANGIVYGSHDFVRLSRFESI